MEESHVSGAAREVQAARCTRLEDRWTVSGVKCSDTGTLNIEPARTTQPATMAMSVKELHRPAWLRCEIDERVGPRLRP